MNFYKGYSFLKQVGGGSIAGRAFKSWSFLRWDYLDSLFAVTGFLPAIFNCVQNSLLNFIY